MWQPGQLQQMIAGRMPFGANPQKVLLGMAGMMVVPSLMPFLSLVLPVPQPMAEYHLRRDIQPNYDYRVLERLVLLHPVRRDRSHLDIAYRLVCVDVEQGSN